MAKLGHRDERWPEWDGMTPEQMGSNATSMMLHSDVFRAGMKWEKIRVTAPRSYVSPQTQVLGLGIRFPWRPITGSGN
ncbi:MAG: hypothetical protein FJX65_16990 [Alphaproteobacteria bacterium]|nr:hypothetical protein [Alphaproteobacteria bacterium]